LVFACDLDLAQQTTLDVQLDIEAYAVCVACRHAGLHRQVAFEGASVTAIAGFSSQRLATATS
jgi:hypothetical protein